MSEPQSPTSPANDALTPVGSVAAEETDASARLPLLSLLLAAGGWAVLASVLNLVASIKFHAPDFLADQAWLTYGRVHPAASAALLYGFGLQAGLGIGLWLLARLGRTVLALSPVVILGALFWNLGVAAGVCGVLAGDSTGFENLEFPAYAAALLFVGYALVGGCGVLTFHRRRERSLFVSQWLLLTALFWFPWIYTTAQLLLVFFPVRGVAQSVIAWWFSENLLTVWFGLAGLAALFYFIPKLTGRELHSHYLALFTYWTLILSGGWTGIPITAPVPAWMTTLSTIATVFLVLPAITVALNAHLTLGGRCRLLWETPVQRFFLVALAAFVLAVVLRVAGTLLNHNEQLQFTWFAVATRYLHVYGFFALAAFGAAYYLVPRLAGREWPFPAMVRAHWWLAALGLVLIVLPLAIGGVMEARHLANPALAFPQVARSTLTFLRVSTIGDLLLLAGHLLFVANATALVARGSLAWAAEKLAAVTAERKLVGAKA